MRVPEAVVLKVPPVNEEPVIVPVNAAVPVLVIDTVASEPLYA